MVVEDCPCALKESQGAGREQQLPGSFLRFLEADLPTVNSLRRSTVHVELLYHRRRRCDSLRQRPPMCPKRASPRSARRPIELAGRCAPLREARAMNQLADASGVLRCTKG